MQFVLKPLADGRALGPRVAGRRLALAESKQTAAGIARNCSSRHSATSLAPTPVGSRFCTCFSAMETSSASRSSRALAAASLQALFAEGLEVGDALLERHR